MPNCDWGRPCDCRDCVERFTRDMKCKCGADPVHTASCVVYGRKGDADMTYRVYCEACWPNRNNE